MYWYDDPMPLSGGTSLHTVDSPPQGDVRAVLWVPDVEQRHGWREFYVRAEAEKPSARRVGFMHLKPGR